MGLTTRRGLRYGNGGKPLISPYLDTKYLYTGVLLEGIGLVAVDLREPTIRRQSLVVLNLVIAGIQVFVKFPPFHI